MTLSHYQAVILFTISLISGICANLTSFNDLYPPLPTTDNKMCPHPLLLVRHQDSPGDWSQSRGFETSRNRAAVRHIWFGI